ncbi:hypothetical protein [Shimazuella alba]|nr:hypothetical protein [Shimazuella alba]
MGIVEHLYQLVQNSRYKDIQGIHLSENSRFNLQHAPSTRRDHTK